MTAMTYDAPASTGTRPSGRDARPSLARLTGVELRKMTDTRAGFWLLAVVALAYAALVVVMLFAADPAELTFDELFRTVLWPSAILLPVMGILAVTSEWSQRTALTTFSLVPDRRRVAGAKLLAGVVLAALSVAVGLVIAAAGNVAGMAFADGDGSWHFGAKLLGAALLFQVINITMGVAIGMLLMNTPLAIVIFFVLPTLWTMLGEMIRALKTPAAWLDLSATTTPLTDATISGGQWAKLAVSVAVWVLLPLTAGLYRLLKREVS
jgi:ABC-2 type transport system permease protein